MPRFLIYSLLRNKPTSQLLSHISIIVLLFLTSVLSQIHSMYFICLLLLSHSLFKDVQPVDLSHPISHGN